MKISFLIYDLSNGGAERQLVTLAIGLAQLGEQVSVATFYAGFPLEQTLLQAGVKHVDLKKRNRWDILGFLKRLIRHVRREKPDVLYGFMGGANILTILVKPLLPQTTIVWGIRSSQRDLSQAPWINKLEFKLNRWLARFADKIITNSQAGFNYHQQLGFPSKKMAVITNGIDVNKFHPDSQARQTLRQQLNITADAKLIGSVARLDPVKDHTTFIQAAAKIAQIIPGCRFICVGTGVDAYTDKIKRQAAESSLDLIWYGDSQHPVAVYNALDVLVSTSTVEGFSNVIAEAMACGVPCVVTDVGDSAKIVADYGRVVDVGDVDAVVSAVVELTSATIDHDELVAHIRDNFSVEQLVNNTLLQLKGDH